MRLARNLIIDDYRKRQRTPHDHQADDLSDHTYHLRTSSGWNAGNWERKCKVASTSFRRICAPA
jgi:DNA-directed RNA polymerase specialized sigma24 family protein